MDLNNHILREAYKLFHQFGVKSITMDDISKHLSISKKTLYKHFANKEELVYQIANGQISNNECQCIETCEKAVNAIHELMLMMMTLRELFKGMNPSLLFDLQKYHPTAWGVMEKHQNEFVRKMIEQNLHRGISEGLYREDINVSILAKLRMEEIRLSFDPTVFIGHTLEEVQVVLLEHFMMGITTMEGHELANKYKNNINE